MDHRYSLLSHFYDTILSWIFCPGVSIYFLSTSPIVMATSYMNRDFHFP